MAAVLASEGKTISQQLDFLYERHVPPPSFVSSLSPFPAAQSLPSLALDTDFTLPRTATSSAVIRKKLTESSRNSVSGRLMSCVSLDSIALQRAKLIPHSYQDSATASPSLLQLPKTLATYPLTSIRDLTVGYDSASPGPDHIPSLPIDKSAHMISFEVGGDDGVNVVGTVRTSGTEPKVSAPCTRGRHPHRDKLTELFCASDQILSRSERFRSTCSTRKTAEGPRGSWR